MSHEPTAGRFVVVPGIWNSGDDHWQTHWERSWGHRAVRIEPSSWTHPDRDDWVAAVDSAVAASLAAAPDDPPVLVAHSLGCLAVAAWLAEHDGVARGALLVAPPDPGAPSFVAEPTGFAFPTPSVTTPTVLVASTDDPYCSIERAAVFADAVGATFVEVGALGHVNVASGIGAWPAGRDLLQLL